MYPVGQELALLKNMRVDGGAEREFGLPLLPEAHRVNRTNGMPKSSYPEYVFVHVGVEEVEDAR